MRSACRQAAAAGSRHRAAASAILVQSIQTPAAASFFLSANRSAMRATHLLADCPAVVTHAMALNDAWPASIGRWIH